MRPSGCSTSSRRNWRDKPPSARRWRRVWLAAQCAVGGDRQSLASEVPDSSKKTKALSRISNQAAGELLTFG